MQFIYPEINHIVKPKTMLFLFNEVLERVIKYCNNESYQNFAMQLGVQKKAVVSTVLTDLDLVTSRLPLPPLEKEERVALPHTCARFRCKGDNARIEIKKRQYKGVRR